jgi:hypothetical protein
MATITTINATDALSDSRGTINTNFTNLNTDKVEKAASSTDNAVARMDGTSGDTIQNSSVLIDDSDVMSGVTQLNVDNIRLDGNTISSTDTNGNIILSPNGTGQVEATTEIVAVNGTATTAGGVKAFTMGSADIAICFGSGAPTLSAPKGSLYLRTDGSGTSDRAYINTDGSTTWTSITTAA